MLTSRHAILFPAITICVSGLAGCTSEIHQYVQFPNFFQPGPARYQRSVGIAHDPYPLDDIGPAVVGARPLAYQQQMPEVDRARLYNPPRRPLQPTPTFAPSVVTPQAAPAPWPPTPPPQPVSPLYPAPPASPPPAYQYP